VPPFPDLDEYIRNDLFGGLFGFDDGLCKEEQGGIKGSK
jgi:hypothetical protein